MNFVDVQPKSFLDYAWTSPSPATMKASKPSRAGRKQNRCCDQCRKGKRACDAAILEDTLLETNKSGGNPTVFHYSGKSSLRKTKNRQRLTRQMSLVLWLHVVIARKQERGVLLTGFDRSACHKPRKHNRLQHLQQNVVEHKVVLQVRRDAKMG
jgi:hypothetical protein